MTGSGCDVCGDLRGLTGIGVNRLCWSHAATYEIWGEAQAKNGARTDVRIWIVTERDQAEYNLRLPKETIARAESMAQPLAKTAAGLVHTMIDVAWKAAQTAAGEKT